jgi:hypothetical protein
MADDFCVDTDEEEYSPLLLGDEEDDDDDDYGVSLIPIEVEDSQIQEAFENGFGVSFTNKTKRVVESRLAKATLPSSITFTPAVISLAVRWARRRKQHFFEDSFNTVKIFAQELGYSILGFLRLRGWWLARDEKSCNKFKIEYRRVKECLEESEPQQSALIKYNRLSALLDRLYVLLHDNSRMVLSGKIITDDDDPTKKSGSIRRPQRDELVSFHDRISFQGKLNREQQHVQIGVSLIQMVIIPLLTKKPQHNDEERIVLEWYQNVFGYFKKRKDFVEALMDMCIAFPTVEAVNLLVPNILNWMQQPKAFISQVRRYARTRRKTTVQFVKDCDDLLDKEFKRSSITHRTRSGAKNYTIMKRRVCSLQLGFQKSKRKAATDVARAVLAATSHQTAEPSRRKSKRRKSKPTTAAANTATVEPTTCPLSVTAALADIPSVASLISASKPSCRSRTKFVTPPNSPASDAPAPSAAAAAPPPLVSLDDPSRWSSFRLATLDDLKLYRLELVVEHSALVHVLQCGPMEFYSIADLRHHHHQFVVDKASNMVEPTTCLTITKQDTCFESDAITVRRPGDECFDKVFGGVVLPMDRIVKWIRSCGAVDQMRDANATSARRVEMGVGGQAPGKSESGAYMPDKLCGEKLFSDDNDGMFMRSVLGKIYDGIQKTSDQTQHNLEKPVSFWNAQRFERYAKKVRLFLYAKDMRQEWLSVQLMHLASLQGGYRHLDDKNDEIEGFNKTEAFCCMFVDAFGDLWSIKFLANARGRIGRNHSATKMIALLKVTLESYLQSIDTAYQQYMLEYKGDYSPRRQITARDSSFFFLDPRCPWTTVSIGERNRSSRCLCLPTTPKREYWLSAAVHWLERMKLTTNQMIEMLFVAGYQNNFHYFYAIGEEMSKRSFEPTEHPSEYYYARSMEMFGNFVGGPQPRYSPPGVHYKESFLNDKTKLKTVVACLRELLEWFNGREETEKVPMSAVKERLQACHKDLGAIGKVEYAEFRLQIFIQMAALSGVVLKPSLLLADFAYPVKGMASYNHLHEKGQVEECDFEDAMEQLKHELQMPTAGRNEIETALCESMPGRYLQKYDVFFWGQDLYRLTKEGLVECKRWDTVVWKVNP